MHTNENETILHADRDDDESAKARNFGDMKQWTIETYSAKVARAMVEAKAKEQPTRTDGRIFTCDARQLIAFLAESSDLIVEFRSRRRQQLSPEKVEARRLRMAQLNAAQRVKA